MQPTNSTPQGVADEPSSHHMEDLPYEELTSRLSVLYASRTQVLETLQKIHRNMRIVEKAIANKDLQAAQEAGKAVTVPSNTASRGGGNAAPRRVVAPACPVLPVENPAACTFASETLGQGVNKHLHELRLVDSWSPSHIPIEGVFVSAAEPETISRHIDAIALVKAARDALKDLGESVQRLLPARPEAPRTSVTCAVGSLEESVSGEESYCVSELDLDNAQVIIGDEHIFLKLEGLIQESLESSTPGVERRRQVSLPSLLLQQGAPLCEAGKALAYLLDAMHLYSTSLQCAQLLASVCRGRNASTSTPLATGDPDPLGEVLARVTLYEGCLTDISQLFAMMLVLGASSSDLNVNRDCVRLFDLVFSLYRTSLDGVQTSLVRILGTTAKLAKEMVPKDTASRQNLWRRKTADLVLGRTLEDLIVYASHQLEDYGRWAPIRHAIANALISPPPIAGAGEAKNSLTVIQPPIGSSLDGSDLLFARAGKAAGGKTPILTKRVLHVPPTLPNGFDSPSASHYQHPHEYAVDYRKMPLMFPLITDINGANFATRILNNLHTAGDFHVLKLRNVPGALHELAKRRPLGSMISELTGLKHDGVASWCPMSTMARAIAFAPSFLSAPCASFETDHQSPLSDERRAKIGSLLNTPNGDRIMALVTTCAHDITLFADKPGLGDVISKSMLTHECLAALGRFEGGAHSYWFRGDPDLDGDERLHYTTVDSGTPLPGDASIQSMSLLLGQPTTPRWPVESEICRLIRNCRWWQPCRGFHVALSDPADPGSCIPLMMAAACDTVGFRFFERLVDAASLPEEQLLVARLLFGFPVAPLEEGSGVPQEVVDALFDPHSELSHRAAEAAVMYFARDLSGFNLLDRLTSFGKHTTKPDEERPSWQVALAEHPGCGLDGLPSTWDQLPASNGGEISKQQALVDEIGSWMRAYRDNCTQKRAVRHGATLCELFVLVFDPIISRCVELSRYRQGCCIIQRCLEFAPDGTDSFFNLYVAISKKALPEKQAKLPKGVAVPEAGNTHRGRLLNAVLASVIHLVNDNYGNYVVQFLMDCTEPFTKGEQAKRDSERARRIAAGEDPAHVAFEMGELQTMPDDMRNACAPGQRRTIQNDIAASQRPYTNPIVRQLLHSVPALSESKFSSNVIERCIELTSTDVRQLIIDEITDPNTLPRLLRDQYGNYVVQSAIVHASTEEQFSQVRDAVKPMLHMLRHSPYGSKIENKLKRRQTRFFMEKQKLNWVDEEAYAPFRSGDMGSSGSGSRRGRGGIHTPTSPTQRRQGPLNPVQGNGPVGGIHIPLPNSQQQRPGLSHPHFQLPQHVDPSNHSPYAYISNGTCFPGDGFADGHRSESSGTTLMSSTPMSTGGMRIRVGGAYVGTQPPYIPMPALSPPGVGDD